MDSLLTAAIVDAGTQLGTLAVKNIASAVSVKVKTVKDEKNIEKVRNTYDEIISELLQERETAIRVAQVYKAELERVEISDDDIEHLNKTVSRLLKIFMPITNGSEEDNASVASITQLQELISRDTLKTMQLLGFNYKTAIGEPLTKICSEAILSLVKNKVGTFANKGTSNKR